MVRGRLRSRAAASIPFRRIRLRPACLVAGAGLFAAGWLGATTETQDAVANGDTRTLSMTHEHTRETITVTYKRDGRYERASLDQLNWFLRDWRVNEATKMDPRVFDVVWEAQRSIGSTQPMRIVSAYRSPRTNAMLRRRSRGVAEFSQHSLGKAIDFFLPDASVDQIRAAGMRLQRGGVGWYPTSGSPFVHLDVGSVRSWPRMTYDQLARLFPDGKTVHLAADNRPLARYAEARAAILSRGGTVLGHTAVAQADEINDGPSLKGFFAGLFGTDGAPSSAPTAAEPLPARSRARPVAVASADPADAAGVGQALAYASERSGPVRGNASAQALLTGSAGPSREIMTSAPLPPRRPAELAAVTAALTMPLPPARPVQVAALGEAGLSGMAHAPVQAPPPARLVPAAADPRSQMRALFLAVSQDAGEPASPAAPVRIADARPRPEAPPASVFANWFGVLTTRFSSRSPGDDLDASRFSGSSTAALPAGN